MIGLVYSLRDPAGSGIARFVAGALGLRRGECDAVECWAGSGAILAGYEEDVIEFDSLDARLPEASFFVVLSRHASEAGVKSYTVHHTGNFGDSALYGGRPRELGVANPPAAFTLLAEMKKAAESAGRAGEYDVCYEATHHGPTSLAKPLTFAEIGSSEREWADPVNHAVVGSAVVRLLREGPAECKPAIGFGGGHYPRKLAEFSLQNAVCLGHIMPKYAADSLSELTFSQMVSRSVPRPVVAVVEKKAFKSATRAEIERLARAEGLEVLYI